MISTAQIRAARGLLNWSQTTLARHAGVSVVTLNMIETEVLPPRQGALEAIKAALEEGGVEFLGKEDVGIGVVLVSARGSQLGSTNRRDGTRGC